MEIFDIKEMTNGWFVGDFEPSIYKTNKCEVGVKTYKKGDTEEKHYHSKAYEITGIIKGKVKMNNSIINQGEFVLLGKDEATDFEALEDTITVVFKSTSVKNDKFLI